LLHHGIFGGGEGIPLLKNAAKELRNLSDKLRQSYLSNFMKPIERFGQATSLADAMMGKPGSGRGHWTPMDLRRNVGMTVYICMRPKEIRNYSEILRLMLDQHIEDLAGTYQPGTLPITFFLDEFPQLGEFQPTLEIQDVGRSDGLRLFFAAQSFGQLKQAYGDRAQSLVSNCKAALYMQPGADELEFLSKILGKKKSAFTAEEEEEFDIHDLCGDRYGKKVICVSPGNHNAVLEKTPAYISHADKLNWDIEWRW